VVSSAAAVAGLSFGWANGRGCAGLRGTERMYCPKGPGAGAGFSAAQPATSPATPMAAARKHNRAPQLPERVNDFM
jgi:hypothetical protein